MIFYWYRTYFVAGWGKNSHLLLSPRNYPPGPLMHSSFVSNLITIWKLFDLLVMTNKVPKFILCCVSILFHLFFFCTAAKPRDPHLLIYGGTNQVD
jgi:hypothetical protein